MHYIHLRLSKKIQAYIKITESNAFFEANQSLLFLLNAACLAKKQQNTNDIFLGLTRSEFEPTIYHAWGEHANNYTTDGGISKGNTI
jgi:hypothetical protein